MDDIIRKRTDACVQASHENGSIGLEACFEVITPPAPVSQHLQTSLAFIVHLCPLGNEALSHRKLKLKRLKAVVNSKCRQNYC